MAVRNGGFAICQPAILEPRRDLAFDELRNLRLVVGEMIDGAEPAIGSAIDAARAAASLDGPGRFEQQPPHHDDGAVRRAEMLLGAIRNRAHSFLNRDVLGVDSIDAGKAARLLCFAVDHEIIDTASLHAAVGQQIIGAAAVIGFGRQSEFRRQRDVRVRRIGEIENDVVTSSIGTHICPLMTGILGGASSPRTGAMRPRICVTGMMY